MGNQKRGFRVLLDGSHLQAAPRRAKCCAGRGANGKVASDRINTSLTSTTASFSTGSAEREGSDRAELGRADEAVEPRGRRKRAAALTAVRQATAIERHRRCVRYAARAVLQPPASLGLLRRVRLRQSAQQEGVAPVLRMCSPSHVGSNATEFGCGTSRCKIGLAWGARPT